VHRLTGLVLVLQERWLEAGCQQGQAIPEESPLAFDCPLPAVAVFVRTRQRLRSTK
jgi:hypothetical protein